jgi:hypothetical protein
MFTHFANVPPWQSGVPNFSSSLCLFDGAAGYQSSTDASSYAAAGVGELFDLGPESSYRRYIIFVNAGNSAPRTITDVTFVPDISGGSLSVTGGTVIPLQFVSNSNHTCGVFATISAPFGHEAGVYVDFSGTMLRCAIHVVEVVGGEVQDSDIQSSGGATDGSRSLTMDTTIGGRVWASCFTLAANPTETNLAATQSVQMTDASVYSHITSMTPDGSSETVGLANARAMTAVSLREITI